VKVSRKAVAPAIVSCPRYEICEAALTEIRATLAALMDRTHGLDNVRVRQEDQGRRIVQLEQREEAWTLALAENTRTLAENTRAMHQMALALVAGDKGGR